MALRERTSLACSVSAEIDSRQEEPRMTLSPTENGLRRRADLARSRAKRLLLAVTRRDELESFYLLRRIAAYLVPEYRLKRPAIAWWHDTDFNRYLELFREDGLQSDRRWMIQQLVRLVAGVVGDTAECGAYKGAGSYLIARMNEAGAMSRTHFVFDFSKAYLILCALTGRTGHAGT